MHASATCCKAYTLPTSHTASCAAWAHAVTCGLHAQAQALENMTHISSEGAHELFLCQCMLGPLAVRSGLENTIHDPMCVHGHMQSPLDFMRTARRLTDDPNIGRTGLGASNIFNRLMLTGGIYTQKTSLPTWIAVAYSAPVAAATAVFKAGL